MIQRIQSVYLFVSFLLLAAGAFSGMDLFLPRNSAMKQVFAESYYVLGIVFIVLLSLGAILSLVDIFCYRKRMKQVKIITVIQLLVIAAYVCFAIPVLQNSALGFETITTPLLPALSLLVCILARKAILKDEKLVRAADRIR